MRVFFLAVREVYDSSVRSPVYLRKVVAYSVLFVGVVGAVVNLAFPVGSQWGVRDGNALGKEFNFAKDAFLTTLS